MRYYCCILSVFVFIMTAIPANAQLIGDYFSSSTAGQFTTLVQTRIDQKIDFSWGQGAPGVSGIGENLFAVRWHGTLRIPTTGNWTFYTTTDDGVRLSVNNQVLVNKWVDQGPTEYSGTLNLSAGDYPVTMEYYENGGGAVAALAWQGPSGMKSVIPASAFIPPDYGLTARYDADEDPRTGAAGLLRVEGPIDFDWKAGTPGSGIPANSFSARWRGMIEVPITGSYIFYVFSDDGSELFVNGECLVDDFNNNHPAREMSGTISLEAGTLYPIDLAFRELSGDAVCRLLWEGPGTTGKELVPYNRLFPIEILQVTRASGINGEASRWVELNGDINLEIVATGAQNPPGYQWYFTPRLSAHRDVAAAPGADSPKLRLHADSEDDSGTYECEVDDGVDVVTSPAFLVTVVQQMPLSNVAVTATIVLILAIAGCRIAQRRHS